MDDVIDVLLIGGGGREHALAWKLAQSPRLGRLFAAPGNAGIALHATLTDLDPLDQDAVVGFCRENGIDLVVVGPEAPLVAGLVDGLEAAGIRAFGPSRAAAQLEGSKRYTKDLCRDAGVPTADYKVFESLEEARDHVRAHGAPLVIKADGLAAGKGVTVAETLEDALSAVDACFAGAHGQAGARVVIEERLVGPEVSLFVLSDGHTALPLGTAQDYKRVGDGDTGPNTGGMGAFSPARAIDAPTLERAMEEIVGPTLRMLEDRQTPYRGVLYAGLMLTPDGPRLIEYNVRFGDPECQVLMMRLEDDLLALLLACADGRLCEMRPSWRTDAALTVVMASKGYPGDYRTGEPIGGLYGGDEDGSVVIFHAGTRDQEGVILSNGGRVLNVTALGTDLSEARRKAYNAVRNVQWPGGIYRSDIGADVCEAE